MVRIWSTSAVSQSSSRILAIGCFEKDYAGLPVWTLGVCRINWSKCTSYAGCRDGTSVPFNSS